jgi:hypothetical protein
MTGNTMRRVLATRLYVARRALAMSFQPLLCLSCERRIILAEYAPVAVGEGCPCEDALCESRTCAEYNSTNTIQITIRSIYDTNECSTQREGSARSAASAGWSAVDSRVAAGPAVQRLRGAAVFSRLTEVSSTVRAAQPLDRAYHD